MCPWLQEREEPYHLNKFILEAAKFDSWLFLIFSNMHQCSKKSEPMLSQRISTKLERKQDRLEVKHLFYQLDEIIPKIKYNLETKKWNNSYFHIKTKRWPSFMWSQPFKEWNDRFSSTNSFVIHRCLFSPMSKFLGFCLIPLLFCS